MGNGIFLDYLKAEMTVYQDILFIVGFQVTGYPLLISQGQRRFQELAGITLALKLGSYTQNETGTSAYKGQDVREADRHSCQPISWTGRRRPKTDQVRPGNSSQQIPGPDMKRSEGTQQDTPSRFGEVA